MIDVETFKRIAAAGGDKVVLLDVRTTRECTAGHLAGSININSAALRAMSYDTRLTAHRLLPQRGISGAIAPLREIHAWRAM